MHMRWRCAVWVCDALAETDALRTELHDQVSVARSLHRQAQSAWFGLMFHAKPLLNNTDEDSASRAGVREPYCAAQHQGISQGTDGEKPQSTTTGWTLFLQKKGGMKNAKEASEQWKADETTRAEYNERAR